MGWGTSFTTDIYISKNIFNSAWELNDKIQELEGDIQNLESQLKMYATANIVDIAPNEWEDDKILWLTHKLNEILLDLDEYKHLLFKLHLYKEFLNDENNTGKDKKIKPGRGFRVWIESIRNTWGRCSQRCIEMGREVGIWFRNVWTNLRNTNKR